MIRTRRDLNMAPVSRVETKGVWVSGRPDSQPLQVEPCNFAGTFWSVNLAAVEAQGMTTLSARQSPAADPRAGALQ